MVRQAQRKEDFMETGKALEGKPYAENPHVRFDEGEVASAAMPRRGSLLYKAMWVAGGLCLASILSATAAPLIGEVEASQDSSRQVRIVYTLSNENAVVTFDVRTNGVSIGRTALLRAWGDVNKAVARSESRQDRLICWQPRETWPDHIITDRSLTVVVTAWAMDAPPDYLVLDLAYGSAPTYYQSEEEVPGGVTNRVYKGDKLVMRRLHSEGVLHRQGSPLDEPDRAAAQEQPRNVVLTNDFYIGIYPVTRLQFGWVMNRSDVTGFNPVVGQTYNQLRGAAPTIDWPTTGGTVASDSQIQAFRTRTGIENIDLPTEAQWEFACRAGTSTARYVPVSSLDDLYTIAWCNGKSVGQEVGLLVPNAFGLYDMLGNATEWCLDWSVDDTYTAGETYIHPVGPVTGVGRALRGGGFENGPIYQRAAFRNRQRPGNGTASCGYRLAISIPVQYR